MALKAQGIRQGANVEGFFPGSFCAAFQLADDPHEDHNLAGQEPKRVDQMVALLRQQISSGRSTPGPDINNERPHMNINQRVPDFVRKLLK